MQWNSVWKHVSARVTRSPRRPTTALAPSQRISPTTRRRCGLGVLILCIIPGLARANDGIRFVDIAPDPASGIFFEHDGSPRHAILDELKQNPFELPDDFALVPHKVQGAPGVALLDFDDDGDLDIYVTNSKGSRNGLFSNQLRETGSTHFIDVAIAAGVDAENHDSSGVCFGDLDNDGDRDLLVLGAIEPNRLFENQGGGAFTDITEQAGVGGGNLSTSSCSMGDVNGDGLLDIAVANTHTSWENLLGIVVPFTFNEHNQLFVNQGGNVFADVSAAAGFETLDLLPPDAVGSAALTWAISLVDYDLDGDLDAFAFDDQGGVPLPQNGGPNYGLIHLHQNDGSGNFTDVTAAAGLDVAGSWMGASFGDLNCDGYMDLFATNLGDYPAAGGPGSNPLGTFSTRWFLGSADGTFTAPGPGDLNGSVFGWGTSMFDSDNDGDTDIAYHGGIDLGFFVHLGIPGVLLDNQGCSANFTFAEEAFARTPERTGRVGQGMAAGDLNEDGFLDVITVSSSDLPVTIPQQPTEASFGSVFDPLVRFAEIFAPAGANPAVLTWTGLEGGNGTLTVELNSADNGNQGAALTLRGSVGTIPGGRVNRDGIGAVVMFKTPQGKAQMVPVVGGSSYASQDSLTAHVGMGTEPVAVAEVLWPGGVRNRLRDLRAGERLVFPEIPCDVDDEFVDPGYRACVEGALDALVEAGVLDPADRSRFFDSAFSCEPGETTLCLNDRRFQVEVRWADFAGRTGPGRVIPADFDDSGLFEFFSPDHLELHVKVVDGCAENNHFWVFAAASTNVEYELEVTDLATGEVQTWANPLGHPAAAVTDTQAFATCP